MDDMISTKDAVLSMAYSLVERGIVPKTDKYQKKEEEWIILVLFCDIVAVPLS